VIPDRLRTLADLERLLAATTNYEERMPREALARAFDLSRTRDLLASVGDPQTGPTTVHVAGSKGKGSTCRMVAEVARAAGRGPVGLYVSPHLERLTERVTVDGVEVDGDALARDAEPLLPHLRATWGTSRFPTFFEVLTAAAHLAFRRLGVRTAVLEVGLGGRLDATNVCAPAATAVTSIELEHVAVLGGTLEAIAAEKAGIVKPGVPCVTAVEPGGPAARVIEEACARAGAPLFRVGVEVALSDARSEPGPRTRARVAGPAGAPPLDVEVPVAGVHQARNAAVAVAIARLLGMDDGAIRRGLARTTLPGRMERVRERPAVVVDAAHTRASAAAARAALADAFRYERLHLVVGALAEKDVAGILAVLLPGVSRVVACAVPSPRTMPADRLAALARAAASPGTDVVTAPDPRAALAEALRLASPSDLVLVTGSAYLAGTALAAVRALPS
jgi:dihydrofolate synthase/folylpolyglutamate synthase